MTLTPLPPVPDFVPELFGWRTGKAKWHGADSFTYSTCSDKDSRASVQIAAHMSDLLDVPKDQIGPSDSGTALEKGVEQWLRRRLPEVAPYRSWSVTRRKVVSDYYQYRHLARLQHIIDADTTNTLGAEIGRDYLVRPDVTVGISTGDDLHLHASVSCKWSIRSDRVQNIRHEAVILTRHRRGRQPHIVAVTAEPLPSRIAAIARGTGEVDVVYHVALDELYVATQAVSNTEQLRVIEELVGQDRLRSLGQLLDTLIV